jgi:hypothetical protein
MIKYFNKSSRYTFSIHMKDIQKVWIKFVQRSSRCSPYNLCPWTNSWTDKVNPVYTHPLCCRSEYDKVVLTNLFYFKYKKTDHQHFVQMHFETILVDWFGPETVVIKNYLMLHFWAHTFFMYLYMKNYKIYLVLRLWNSRQYKFFLLFCCIVLFIVQ